MTTCKNCTHRFEGNFCNSCGQSSHTHEINLHYVIHEIQHGVVHIDRGFFFTIKELFTRPGNSIREYIEGKRVNHFKPLAFLLILSTAYVFLSHALHHRPALESAIMGFKSVPDDKLPKGSYAAFDWVISHYAYASLLIVPLSSLASYLAFVKSKYNYFQHLVINAFVSGQTTVFYIVCLFITYFINKDSVDYLVDTLGIIIGFLLTLWTYFQLFNDIKTPLKIALTILNYILFLLFLTISSGIILSISKALA